MRNEEYKRVLVNNGILAWQEKDNFQLLLPEQMKCKKRSKFETIKIPKCQKFEVDQDQIYAILIDILCKIENGRRVDSTL
jgi:hypothetical protein